MLVKRKVLILFIMPVLGKDRTLSQILQIFIKEQANFCHTFSNIT